MPHDETPRKPPSSRPATSRTRLDGSTSSNTRSTPGMIPEEVRLAPPAARFGKYVCVRKIGAGGMGEVWKAWDLELARWVALKFLKGDDENEIARFVREARTAGNLTHPHIAAIYDVGETNQRHFIAMQFVEGVTLKHISRTDRRALVGMIRDAAAALEYAHEQGVVHRDIKPDNLMCTAGARPHLFVMDFGLARAIEGASELSVSGQIVGTPSYMPPEQARGRDVDGRSDVYSLGATLYDLLTGRPPFRGASIYETVRDVIEKDPVPPRKIKPSIESDLETIVLKCLEKDPGRRYSGIGDLTRDLDRWLEGEAIQARPMTLSYRIRKKLAKRKAATAIAIGAVVLIGALLGFFIPKLGEKRAVLLEQMRETTDSSLQAALDLRRSGNLEGMKKFALKVEDICRRAIARFPDEAEPHYRMGRIHRAQMKDDAALEEQNRALKLSPDFGPSLYERILLVSRLYRVRMQELAEEAWRREGDRANREGGIRAGSVRTIPEPAALMAKDGQARELHERLEADLKRLENSAQGVSVAEVSCAKGLKAWVSGDTDSALALLSKAVETGPGLEEAYESLASIEEEKKRYVESIDWWTRGIEKDQGYLPHREGRALTRYTLAVDMDAKGEDASATAKEALLDFKHVHSKAPDRDTALAGQARVSMMLLRRLHTRGKNDPDLYASAIRDLSEAVRLNPQREFNWMRRAILRMNQGSHEDRMGQSPVELYQEAADDFTEVTRRWPDRAPAWYHLGGLLMNWSNYAESQGEKTDSLFQRSQKALDEALRLNPGLAEPWQFRGALCVNWANLVAHQGGDAEPLVRKGIEDLGASLKLNGENANTWRIRGGAHATMATHLGAAGKDPSEHFTRAMEDFSESIRLAPYWDEPLSYRGTCLMNRGIRKGATGQDPEPDYSASIADLTKALGMNPDRDETWTRLGTTRMNLAYHRAGLGNYSEDLYRQAIQDLTEALSRNRGNSEAAMVRGMARFNLGKHGRNRGIDPQPVYEEALADLTEAIRLRPGSDNAYRHRGDIHTDLGEHLRRTPEAEPHFGDALRDFTEALKLNPKNYDALVGRAEAHLQWSDYKSLHGTDPLREIEGAMQDLNDVLARFPKRERALTLYGAMHLRMALERRKQGKDPLPLFRIAIDNLTEAVRLDPKAANAWFSQGSAHYFMADNLPATADKTAAYREALGSYEKYLEFRKHDTERIKPLTDNCRKWLADHPGR